MAAAYGCTLGRASHTIMMIREVGARLLYCCGRCLWLDDLMKALVSGGSGFKLLSQVLIIMLQTLLQDQLAEVLVMTFVFSSELCFVSSTKF